MFYKKILFCCFVILEVTAMNLKRKPQEPSPSATYYQNIEDTQHGDAVNSGFKKQSNDNSQNKSCIVCIISDSKKVTSRKNN